MFELWLALSIGSAAAAPTTVVTFDNGEFNAPLYTPRWNGRWKQPSAAQEIAASIARVAGTNPEVHTYLPPGQGRAGPGGHTRVQPIKAGCSGASTAPTDPCWCGPADNCWGGLQPNWYPDASTSLYLTAQNLRSEAGSGPRLEVHVTDLFEEDPSAAENPADSDRCVTRDGVRRALGALLTPPEGASLDHLAVGLLRARIDPPPPGSTWGYTYGLTADDARCHSGHKTGVWGAGRPAMPFTVALLVVGLDTANEHTAVSAFLDGLVGQLDAGDFEFELLRVVEPPVHRAAERVVSASNVDPLVLQPVGPLPTVPCGNLTGTASLTSGGRPLVATGVTGTCDGALALTLEPSELRRAFLAQAGIWPQITGIDFAGEVVLTSDRAAFDARLAELRALNASERSLPLWSAVEDRVVELSTASPWTTTVEVRSVRVTDADTRPWMLVTVASSIVALVVGMGSAQAFSRLHASRAMRRHWTISLAGGRDPLLQRPIAAVLGAAQEEVARAWPLRVTVGVMVGLSTAVASMMLLLVLHRVMLG